MKEPLALAQKITTYEAAAAEKAAALLARDFRQSPLCVVSLAMAVRVTPYQLSRCFHGRFHVSIEAYAKRLHRTPALGRQWVMLAI